MGHVETVVFFAVVECDGENGLLRVQAGWMVFNSLVNGAAAKAKLVYFRNNLFRVFSRQLESESWACKHGAA